MAIQISDLSAILEKIIAPAIQRNIFKETLLLDKFPKNSGITKMPNNTFYLPFQTGHHAGVYAVAEGAQIRKGAATYAQPYVSAKYSFGSFELTDQAIEAASNDRGAVKAILMENADSLKVSFRRDLNRTLHGDGTGQLCLTNGAQGGGGGTTLTVKAQTMTDAKKKATEYLYAGGYISIGGGSAVQISTVDSDTQVTLATATTWSDSAVVTRAGADEAMGLLGLIDDGDHVSTVQGITRASNPFTIPFTDDTSEALSESDMIDAWLSAKKYGKPKVLLMGQTLYAKYGSILTSMKKTANSMEVLGGGWRGLEFMGGEGAIMLDFDTPAGIVQIVDFDAFTIGEMTPMGWLDRGAGILTKIPDYAKWEGTMRYYWNLICKNFRANARLSNKTG